MTHNLLPAIEQVVVFDTNAYREIAGKGDLDVAITRVEQLIAAERSKGIQALGFATVFAELLVHLADTSSSSYAIAKAAIAAAVRHCEMPLDGGQHPAVWSSPDLQLCKTFWNKMPEDLIYSDDLARAMAKRVADDPSEQGLDQFRDDLRTVADRFAKAELEFAVSMKQHLMGHMMASAAARGHSGDRKELLNAYRDFLDSDDARLLTAEAHVLRAASHAGVEEAPEEVSEKARWFAEKFRVPIELYLRTGRKIAESNWDLTTGKGANTLWDLQIAFLLGDEHSVEGRPALVVSADDAILTAASEGGAGEKIMSYLDYRQYLRS